jgi:hypothetical protein
VALHSLAAEAQGQLMNSTVHAFTSVTTNYIPKARVLAASIKQVDPSVYFHLLLSDDLPDGFNLDTEPFDNVIFADTLPVENFKQWVFSHRLVELCTAVKGLALETIFEEHGAQKAFYFDPDIVVFSRLDDLVKELDRYSILLTPHQSDPEKSIQGIIDNEMCSLRHGVFNMGFVGVANTPDGRAFSRWWRDRLIHFCRDDHSRALFTDQKWVNLAPCMFDGVRILRNPGFNVATWNLSNRRATGSIEKGIRINDEDLGFYHFSGFDSGAQERQLKEYGSHSPVLFALRQWYIDACEQAGQSKLGKIPAKYNFYEDGTRIEDAQRILYRERADLQRTFPDPFATSGYDRPDLAGGYRAWYQAHGTAGSNDGVITVRPDTSIRDFLSSAATYLERRAEKTATIGWLKKRALHTIAACMRGAARLASGN